MRNKKVLIIAIVVALALVAGGLVLFLTADKECDHEWLDATCSAPKTCKLCQATEGEAQHEWLDATCTEPKHCKNCSKTEGAALGHTGGVANCVTGAECTRCGEEYGEVGTHVYSQNAVKPEALKSAATCQSAAVYYKSCACGLVSTDEGDTFTFGDALAHTFDKEAANENTLKAEATCQSAAVYYKSCSCGAISESNLDVFTSGELGAHVYDQVDIKPEALKSAATCQNAAVYYKSCSCGAVSSNETDVFEDGAPLDHNYLLVSSMDATCTEGATETYECVCGDGYTNTVGAPLGHDISDVAPTEKAVDGSTCKFILVYTCKREGCSAEIEDGTIERHNYIASITKEATCAEDGVKTYTCECGDSKTEAIPKNESSHTWIKGVAALGTRTDTCSACGATKSVTVYEGNQTDSTNTNDLKDKEIELNDANINLGNDVLDAIGDKNVTVSADKLEGDDKLDLGLSEDQLAQVGDNPIYNFTINDGTENISQFGEDNYVTITLPYTLSDGEDVDSIAIWFINDDGELEAIEATYSNGYVTFKTNHFSYYTVTRLTPAERCALYGHSYTHQTQEATCTKAGYDLHFCVRCHDQYKDNEVEALGHSFSEATTEPTCTKAGNITYTCENCNYSYKTRLSAIGHNYVSIENVDATCKANGYEKFECDGCGKTYTTNKNKLSHEIESTVVEATCDREGHTLNKCKNCDYSYATDYTAALGHDYAVESWIWAEDYSSATLEFVCRHDATHVVSREANISVSITRSSCSEYYVKTVYTATVLYNGQTFEDTKETEKGSASHVFGDEWKSDEKEHWHECACGEKTDVTEHSFANETITKEPTCTENGEKTSYCSCGAEHKTEIEALGHDFVEDERKEPTCAEEGYIKYVCSSCEEAYEEAIEMLPHDIVDTAVEPTCTTGGYTLHECKNCDYSVKDGETASRGHVYEAATTAPTCVAQGYTTYTCACGYTYVDDYMPELPHNFVNSEEKASTCTEEGYIKSVCSCGEEMIMPLPMLEHDMVDTVVEPTCTTGGYTLHECKNCDYSYKDNEKAPYEHKYIVEVTAPTCTEKGYTTHTCACGDTYVDAYVDVIPHNFIENSRKEATCTEDGFIEYLCACGEKQTQVLEKISHNEVVDAAVAPTCTATGLTEGSHCSECKAILVAQVEIPMIAHTYDEGDWDEDCNVCGTVRTCAHDGEKTTVAGKAPTCTETGLTDGEKCAVCGDITKNQEVISALGHSVVVDAAVAPTCTATGLTEGSHCSVCSETLVAQEEVEALGHSVVVDAAVAPTCTATGLTEGSHCSVCSETLVAQEEVKELGHSVVVDAAVAPTCTATGLTEGSHCSVCSETLVAQEEVEALGHSVVVDAAVAPTCTATGLTEGSHCSVCSETLAAQEEVEALGHTYETAVTAPTCVAQGYTTYTCACGDTYVDDYVDATGEHSYVDGACSVCGKAETDCDHTELHEETVDLSEHGACNFKFTIATCDCGEVKYLIDDGTCDCVLGDQGYEYTYDDDGNIIGAKATATCSVCGLYLYAEMSIEQNGCVQTMLTVYTFSINDTVILDNLTMKQEYVNHEEEEHTIDLSEFEGCCGGIITVSRCKHCGLIDYIEDFEPKCSFDMETEPVPEEIVGEDGVVHYVQTLECPDCDIKFVVDSWIQEYSACESSTFRKMTVYYGEETVVEYTYSSYQNRHEWEYTYELEEGATCEDTYKVVQSCTVCGAEDYWYSSGHRTEGEKINFADYGACGGNGEIRRCTICGEITQYYGGYYECKFESLSEDILDDNGEKIGTRRTQICSECGLTIVTETIPQLSENCELIFDTSTTVSINGTVIIDATCMSYWGTQHQYEYAYEMLGENCGDGYTVTETCTVCGYSNSYTSYEHRTEWFEINLSDYGGCEGYISGDKCTICGEITYLSDFNIGCYIEEFDSLEEVMGDDGYLHTIQSGTCPNCELTFVVDMWTEVQSDCVTLEKYKVSIYSGETEVFAYVEVETYDNHDYQYEYTKRGETCDDGVDVIVTCSNCDYYEQATYWGHVLTDYRYDYLGDCGIRCGGYVRYRECLTCDEYSEIYWNNQCNWYIDLGVNEEGYKVSQCGYCGAIRHYMESNGEKDENCMYSHTETTIFFVDGVEVYRFSNSYRTSDHNWEYSCEFEGEPNCKEQYKIIETCSDCGESNWWYHSGHFREYEYVYLDEYGMCEGYIQVEKCIACDYEDSIFVDNCYWSFLEDDEDGRKIYECRNCGALRYTETVVGEKNESCYVYGTYNHTIYKGGVEIGKYSQSFGTSAHNVKVEYTMYGDSCEDGWLYKRYCLDCGTVLEEWENFGHSMMIEPELDLTGCCEEHYLRIRSCPCGESVDYYIDLSWNDETNSYYCSDCGLTFSETVEWIENGCVRTRVKVIRVTCGDREIFNESYTADYLNHSFKDVEYSVNDGLMTLVCTCEKCKQVVTLESQQAELVDDGTGNYYYDYTFVPEETASYTIMSMTSGDTYVILYQKIDGELVEIAYNDDGSSYRNFYLSRVLEAGTEYVYRIRFLDSSKNGTITFMHSKLHTSSEANNCQHGGYYFSQLLDGSESCEDGAIYGSICPYCARLNYINETTNHNTTTVYSFDASANGCCEGHYIYIYSCACGKEHWYSLNLNWDSESQCYACSDCGLSVENLSEWVEDGCVRNNVETIIIKIGENEIFRSTTSVEYLNHNFSNLEYVVNGDEKYILLTCEGCEATRTVEIQQAEITYQDDGHYYYDFIFTPDEDGYYFITSMGDKDTYLTLYRLAGDELEYIYYNNNSGYNYNFRMEYYLTAGETYVYRISFNGVEESGTVDFIFDAITDGDECNHSTFYNSTLLDGSESCEDGILRAEICKYCGRIYRVGTEYYHNTTQKDYVNLSELGACYGYLQSYSCVCGENQGINRHFCYDSYDYSEGYDDNGNYVYTYAYTCSSCGMALTRSYYTVEDYDNCKAYTYTTITVSFNDEVVLVKEYQVERPNHDYEVSFEMYGESCTDGYKIIYTCVTCGDSYEGGESYYHSTYYKCFNSENGLDCCEDHYVEVGACPCGYYLNIYTNLDWNSEEQIYRCDECGLTCASIYEENENGCLKTVNKSVHITLGEEIIYSNASTVNYFSHNFANVSAEYIEGNYVVNAVCSDCGESASHSSTAVTIVDDGNGSYYFDYEFTPESTSVYYLRSFGDVYAYLRIYEMNDDGQLSYYGSSSGFSTTERFYEGETYVLRISASVSESTLIQFFMTENYVFGAECNHSYDAEFACLLNGSESCEDGILYGRICRECGKLNYAYVNYSHTTSVKERIDLSEHGACYGTYTYSECACGQEENVSVSGICAYTRTYNTYYDDESRLVHVTTRTCSSCGLRFDRSYYTVKDTENCTLTYYYTDSLTVNGALIVAKSYTREEESHDLEYTGVLTEGATSCENGVTITYTCKHCDYSYSYTTTYHDTFPKEILDLRDYGSVCGGYMTVYECACGYRGSISMDQICDFGSTNCLLWIEDAITEGQYTINGWYNYYSNSYIMTCAVTDPEQCAFKIRYASYWLKDENSCVAYKYETYQLGYDEETDSCLYEITYKTGNYRTYHNYVLTQGDHSTHYDCADCGSYYYDDYYYFDNGNVSKYERKISNTTGDGSNKYYELIREYDYDANGSHYQSRDYEKRIYSDDTEWYRESTYTPYTGTFGDTGWEVMSTNHDRYGSESKEQYAYVYYLGYQYYIYSYSESGDYWYRYDYTYSFDGECLITTVYTNSDGEESTNTENCCKMHSSETIKYPTCTQDGAYCYECVICGRQSESYASNPYGHAWSSTGDNGYYCVRCGLENVNGADGTIVMSDLTSQYGNGESYVVGYWNQGNVDFTKYVSILLEDGTELILEGIEFGELDGLRAVTFSKAAVEEAATALGYSVNEYLVRFAFVPYGADSTLDYAITFTETLEYNNGDIANDVSFKQYIGSGETVSFTITPTENSVWTFTSEGNYDTYGYLYDSDGNQLRYNDDGGVNTNFLISYTLTAGETYIVSVRWYSSSTAGFMSLIFDCEPTAQ